ncbi:sn-glycerol-3-phosphate ABC transporter ATP-binding protein UgpC [Siccirubricoccus sp. KC 17139]|uniref:Sn-glycerol-3-phosphate ABC transporter ATP-binding protein UgpC n=1 Tax=Siccirubricoccus soli TaxID=2899147 RepID=A0ABT1CZ73_9PROT|nr:sn-glycerol-3-phosphate ABC transporter ATP-binding protein UgpC [Siccirubricoccus soli]MCO6414707.1 sn-glycerol-3-phosphate ABC transporter ATP-binding protein UgpC [Siccirubricoccus soli]MCP2680837.1 sn-glycerol-3-phosphate ABC transporter ATP-binding protein UgpC [Siccirubricoccus soli]
MATLQVSGLRKAFGATRVLHGVDLAVADGEMIVIVGASGCGKSTLLRLVAGLESPTEGRILIDGRDVTGLEPAERDIAMVFQNYALYPHMTVSQNMGYGLRIRGLPKPEIARRVDEAAKLLGIEALLERRPRQLSGGQRQRVAMGRAIVREPKLFLFDEPLSNLDAKLRVQMRAEIRRLQQRLGVTSLFVTHDQVEAMTLGDRLVVMHQGHAAQVATPMEVWAKPADTYVAGFIGSPAMNFLVGTLAEGGAAVALRAGPVLRFADGPRPGPEGMRLTIGIRPEHVRPATDGLPLAIELVEPLGSETVLHGALPDGEALVVKLAGAAPRDGALHLDLPPEALHVFRQEDGKRLEPG